MASLSRYALRIGIILALLITLSTMISASVITNSVQENIATIQEQRIDYLEADAEISDSLFDLSRLFEAILSNQYNLFLTNYLDENLETSDLTIQDDFLNLTKNVRQLLFDREQNEYELSDINPGPFDLYVMFQDVPKTKGIITAVQGAYGTFNTFASIAEAQIQFIAALGDSQRFNLNEDKGLLKEGNEDIENYYQVYRQSLFDFEGSLFENATIEALELMELNSFLDANASLILEEYNRVLFQLFDTPLDVSIVEIIAQLDQFEESLDAINSTLFSFGMSSEHQNLYHSVTGNLTLLSASMRENIELHITDFLGHLNDVNSILTRNIPIVTTTFRNAVSGSLEKLVSENAEFDDLTSEFISSIVTSSSTVTIFIFSILTAVVGIVFIWIIIAMSRNLGRILSKMSTLAEGDLTITPNTRYGRNEMGLIEHNIDTFALQMRSILTSMKHSSETLAGFAEELAAGAEEASASITEVNSTMREFSSGSSEQNLMLNRVREELIAHLNIVEQTANSIDETAQFVLRVAKRTNILGLNASIEAAKAGRFGLGFNVVAEEVRSLSDETQDSANRIAKSIESIEFNIRQTVQDILDEVNIIREVAENTATGSEDASMATAEQVTMMNEVTQTSAQLSDLSNSLNQMMQNFTV